MKPRLGNYTKSFMSLWDKFVGISYMFFLYVVGKEDPIEFFCLLCWYLPHVADIIAGGFRCCLILCL